MPNLHGYGGRITSGGGVTYRAVRWETPGLGENTGVKQGGTKIFGTLRVAYHHRSDRGLRAAQVKAKGTQLRLTEASIIPQLLYDVRCLLQHVHCRQARRHIRRCSCTRKQERTTALLKIVNQHAWASDIATNDPKRF